MHAKRITAPDIAGLKGNKRICVVTAYDFPTAWYADQAGVDAILVGDSLGMTGLGLEDTLGVGMEEMVHHTKAVGRGVQRALIIADMPFLTCRLGVREAVRNAGRFLRESRARAVKVEGAGGMLEPIAVMVEAGIPVMGHLGLTPQSLATLGGFKVQGRTPEALQRLIADAKALQEAGCFSLVLEAMPPEAARAVTDSLRIPTIGIGAGPHCDGQVLVGSDVLGITPRTPPKFVKQYARLGPAMQEAFAAFRKEVESGEFPDAAHCYKAS